MGTRAWPTKSPPTLSSVILGEQPCNIPQDQSMCVHAAVRELACAKVERPPLAHINSCSTNFIGSGTTALPLFSEPVSDVISSGVHGHFDKFLDQLTSANATPCKISTNMSQSPPVVRRFSTLVATCGYKYMAAPTLFKRPYADNDTRVHSRHILAPRAPSRLL